MSGTAGAPPDPADPLLEDLRRRIAPGRFPRLGVAVSGGGDSIALLHLAAATRGPRQQVLAVTVDHGLRPEAAEEARQVAGTCAGLGIAHATLRWTGWDGQGNLQDRARQARRALIGDWAAAEGVGAVLLGHTADDQAETVLLRLLRGSGVDGLSGMREETRWGGLVWLRPLLGQRRADLRAWLRQRDIPWIDDPSNEDPRFDRVRARGALAALAGLGLGMPGLVETAARMDRARQALAHFAAAAQAGCESRDAGDLLWSHALWDLPEETCGRLVSAGLGWVGGSHYRPRYQALTGALAALRAGRAATLSGCLMLPEAGGIRLTREWQAVRGLVAPAAGAWDGRWQLLPPPGCDARAFEIRALGEAGLAALPEWRGAGRPRAALLAEPAVWSGADLVAAPLVQPGTGWCVRLTLPGGSCVDAASRRAITD